MSQHKAYESYNPRMSFSINECADTSLNTYNIKAIKLEIQKFVLLCEIRCLNETKLWLVEVNKALKADLKGEPLPKYTFSLDNYETYLLACMCFNVQEYSRAAFYAKLVNTEVGCFLYHCSLYKTLETNKPIDFTDSNTITNLDYHNCWRKLNNTLESYLRKYPVDGFSYYLRALVLIQLNEKQEAIEMLQSAIRFTPLLWQAWNQLTHLVADKVQLNKLKLPCHWIKGFFLVKMYLKLEKNDKALNILSILQKNGFKDVSFITSSIAHIYHNKSELEKAIKLFQKLQTKDRYRLEDMDTYSNLLYVSEMTKELAYLAHNVFNVDRYTIQSCTVLGNYYSLRGDHLKSAEYFCRAVKLNPTYAAGLILRGHEFMEVKNTRNALQCYREAISMNYNDFRAWYGLGQTYEIKRMPFQALFYYKRAFLMKPDDSRILIALGEVYEKLNQINNAIRCYKRARNVGDTDSFAIRHLAKLYSEMNSEDEAAKAFRQLVAETESTIFTKEHGEAYRFLGYYYSKRKNYKLAFRYALLCLNFEEVKEDGKFLMKEITGKGVIDAVMLDENFSFVNNSLQSLHIQC